MFVAWRELTFSKARFVLIGTVVLLMTVLVGFLSGLAAGLANQNTSAITSIEADRIVFSRPPSGGAPSFDDSTVTKDEADVWVHRSGVTDVHPLGISQSTIVFNTQKDRVTIFGAAPEFSTVVPVEEGTIALPRKTAQTLGVSVGDRVTLATTEFRVNALTDDSWYSHTPVIYTTLVDWQRIAFSTGRSDAFATVLAVRSNGADFAAADSAANTVSSGILESLTGLKSFKSEMGSLLLIVALLFGISTILVCAFFTVWGFQRQPDIAVLKALGASTRSLVIDALGQAAIILILGVGIGVGLTALFGVAVSDTVPFIISPLTTVVPGTAMITLGLIGAACALRTVTTADPLTALGARR